MLVIDVFWNPSLADKDFKHFHQTFLNLFANICIKMLVAAIAGTSAPYVPGKYLKSRRLEIFFPCPFDKIS